MENNVNSNQDIVDVNDIDEVLNTSANMETEQAHDAVKNEEECQGKVEAMMVVDEWDDCGIESESEEDSMKRDMSYINPEDVERAVLNLPAIRQLNEDMADLKHTRKVTASPLNIIDLTDSHIVELISWNTLREFQSSFVRDAQNPQSLIGIINLSFTTCKSALNAIEHLKAWNSSLEVKYDKHANHSMEAFVDRNGLKKKWTDNVAVLKNLSAEVTEDAIRDLFPYVEDVVMHLDTRQVKKSLKTTPTKASDPSHTDASNTTTTTTPPTDNAPSMDTATEATDAAGGGGGGGGEAPEATSSSHDLSSNPVSALPSAPPKGFAYLVFGTEEVMRAEVEVAAERRLELCGHKLMLLAYKTPVHAIPRTYLRLRERKAIMSYIDRCTSKLEALKQNPAAKVPQALEQKITKSKAVLENDNSSRKELGLSQPTLDELACMNGLPRLNSALIQKTLVRYGIMTDKTKEVVVVEATEQKRFKGNTQKFRGGNRRNYSPSRRGRRSPYRRTNRKPYGGSYHPGNRNTSRNSSQTSLLGNAALTNPLAQLVMQQNLLGVGGGAGVGGGYAGNAGMDGLLTNPYTRGLDSHGQLIRLDETASTNYAGNFRADNEARYPALGHYNDTMHPNPNDYRRRSRSPRGNYGRRDNSGGVGGIGGGRGGGGMGRGGRGLVGAGDDSVNLLLNLSQMLSNKMDQKRQQLEQDKRGSYNRRYDEY